MLTANNFDPVKVIFKTGCTDSLGEYDMPGSKALIVTSNGSSAFKTGIADKLKSALDEKGIGYAKTAVGDKYVYENMVKNHFRIGGEQSGHIIFSQYATTGDGILTAIKVMEVLMEKKMPLSELAAPVRIYPQMLKNIKVRSKPEAQNDPDVQAAVAAVAEKLGDTGRILVRESGTEPVIRVMVEAKTVELAHEVATDLADFIKKLV